MENNVLNIKKKQYNVIKEIDEHTFVVENNEKKYVIKTLGPKSIAFSNFKFANKVLKAAGVVIPKLIKADKKNGNVLIEYIEGETVFDLLLKGDLDEKIIEHAFLQNWHARVNKVLLDFNPRNFIWYNNWLYYMPYTFDEYKKELDFSTNGIRLWFYTKELKEYLISQGLPVDKSRIKPEFEQNKEIVLQVVKYYR